MSKEFKAKNPNYWREWHEKNPNYGKKYREKNRDKIRAYNKKYREENYDKYMKYQIDFYVKKKEKSLKEEKEKEEQIKINKSVINLSSNIKSDLFNENEIENNLHTIYDSSTNKFVIPTKNIYA
tara:strand:- start:3223 stop:3594 length:372 start_codon:yes stop_codon:yes gene_type:complete